MRMRIKTLWCILLSATVEHSCQAFLPSSTRHVVTTKLSESQTEDPLDRTKRQLEKIKGQSFVPTAQDGIYQEHIQKPATVLKNELISLRLSTKGRKPDLAQRLTEYYIAQKEGEAIKAAKGYDEEDELEVENPSWVDGSEEDLLPVTQFASLALSPTAGTALAKAQFRTPSSIQSKALPRLAAGESLILHAETGSGKTLCYLLPITERLWQEQNSNDEGEPSYALILLPTRELAAQVAGVATALSPPNSVRLVTTPTNLVRQTSQDKERSEGEYGGRYDFGKSSGTKLIVGSAKSILTSLFGDSKMPAPPTSKPEAKKFIQNVSYVVLDEVDRLLNIKTSRASKSKFHKKHEKPAGILCATIARSTFGEAQIVAASATVGRPLRRELARVLGLLPNECPDVVMGLDNDAAKTRAVTVPKSLNHYVLPSMGEDSSGSLLTTAAFLIKRLPAIGSTESPRGRKTLLVMTNGIGISIRDAIGAMKHFNVQPHPRNLLDILQASGSDDLIKVHREVSGASGLGESATHVSFDESEGYVIVTGEDSVRGLHLDELDTVIVVGRPKTPDEYIHIAGRAGRAKKKGSVVNVVSYDQARGLTSWESILGIDFIPIDDNEDVSHV